MAWLGLAHELNNPAAANRTVTQLSDSIQEWRLLVEKLNVAHGMTAQQWSYISELRKDASTLDLNTVSRYSSSLNENSSTIENLRQMINSTSRTGR